MAIKLKKKFINDICKIALKEDLYPNGDITSKLIKKSIKIKTRIKSNYRRFKSSKTNFQNS